MSSYAFNNWLDTISNTNTMDYETVVRIHLIIIYDQLSVAYQDPQMGWLPYYGSYIDWFGYNAWVDHKFVFHVKNNVYVLISFEIAAISDHLLLFGCAYHFSEWFLVD